MSIIDTVVIGAGHAGLAVSRLLTKAGRDHVVLDRGRLAESWRSERWDSLHLLSPNWMTRLPGWIYAGPDQDGYMSAGRFVRHLEKYAASFAAPVQSGTTVEELVSGPGGYRVVTDRGTWRTRHVVIATGPWGRPHVPAALEQLDSGVQLLSSSRYRNPAGIQGGGVLVVGSSASGVQIADELARAGRKVVLAVGRHARTPRRYRGMDIYWWLERTGRLARTIDQMPDPVAARREPSMQLVGRNEPEQRAKDLDLRSLQQLGVRLVGRVTGSSGTRLTLAEDAEATVQKADRRMHRVLDDIDRHIDATGLTREVDAPNRPLPIRLGALPRTVDLKEEGIGTVLLATGFRPHHPWLRLPITGPDGTIVQRRGVTAAPGVYVVGQRFQHRRDSGSIDGARHNAHDVVGHLCGQVPAGARRLADEDDAVAS